MKIYQQILQKKSDGQKQFAILVDPDKLNNEQIEKLCQAATGNGAQVDEQADALLFLSLISGRNADLLIGKHVVSAPIIREKQLEAISTGYMLIESGSSTTALYMSNTHGIPADK